MIVCTSEHVPGYTPQILGMVRGNIVTTKHIGRDIMASVRSIAGGEVKSYTQMTNEAREEAERRMVAAAEALGADAVVMCRFSSSTPMEGTIEMLCYGTAVKLVPVEQ